MIILKVPSSQGGLGKSEGCEEAPNFVLNNLKNIFLNEDGRKEDFEVGEVKVVKSNLEETNKNIYERVKRIEAGIVLGGDHSITYSSFKAFSEKFKNCGLIVFDAHADCENDFSPPSHEDFLRMLIKDDLVKAENVFLVGLRNWHDNERDFLKENKVKVFSMKNIFEFGVKNVCDSLMENVSGLEGVYLSLDIDVVDPGFAPGTFYKEVGGLSSRELIYFLQRLKLLKNLKIVDLVEINPKKDLNNLTINLGSKVLKELI